MGQVQDLEDTSDLWLWQKTDLDRRSRVGSESLLEMGLQGTHKTNPQA